MTQEEFIEVLKEWGYSYEIEGDKIIVTYGGWIDLDSLKTLPSGVHFKNGGDVKIKGLDWVNNNEEIGIEGVGNKRLLNLMISKSLFI